MLTLALLAMLSVGAAQERVTPPQPPAAQSTSATEKEQSYRVSGTVVDAASGAPLSGAQVTITSRSTQDAEGVLTDEEGRFAFENLAAGKYVLSAKRTGYLEQLYKQHQQFSTAIITGPGLNTANLRFELRPGASISGVVTDEAGEPVRNAQVTLIQREVFMGRRNTFQRGGTITNDLGQFRFGHLTPGTYFIAVSATPWYAQRSQQMVFSRTTVIDRTRQTVESGSQLIPPEPEFDVVYATIFFPNSLDLAGAAPITVRSGDAEVADVRLQAVPGARIIVRTPAPKEGENVWANVTQQWIEGQRLSVPAATLQIAPGVLEISGLPVGRVDVDVTVNNNKGTRSTSRRQSVEVSGADTEISIGEGSPPVRLSGVARFDDGSSLTSAPRLQLRSTTSGAWYQLQSEKDGTFEVKGDGVARGAYELWVMPAREPQVVKSIRATNAKATSDRGFEVTGAGDVKLDVVLSRGTGTITGFALKDSRPLDAVMVALVPEQPERNLVLFRRDQSDSDGSFNLAGVHPGKYTLIAIENGWDIEWLEPGALKKYLASGERIEVTPNAKLEVKVNVQ